MCMKWEFKEITEQPGVQTKNKNSNQFYSRNIYEFWCHWVSEIFLSLLQDLQRNQTDLET